MNDRPPADGWSQKPVLTFLTFVLHACSATTRKRWRRGTLPLSWFPELSVQSVHLPVFEAKSQGKWHDPDIYYAVGKHLEAAGYRNVYVSHPSVNCKKGLDDPYADVKNVQRVLKEVLDNGSGSNVVLVAHRYALSISGQVNSRLTHDDQLRWYGDHECRGRLYKGRPRSFWPNECGDLISLCHREDCIHMTK